MDIRTTREGGKVRNALRILGLALVVFILAYLVYADQSACREMELKVTQLEQQVGELHLQLAQVARKNESIGGEIGSLQETTQAKQKELGNREKEIESSLVAQRERLLALEGEVTSLSKEVIRLQRVIEEIPVIDADSFSRLQEDVIFCKRQVSELWDWATRGFG